MVKYSRFFIAVIVLLALLALIAGCSKITPASAEEEKADTKKAESVSVEPEKTEIPIPATPAPEPEKVEPEKAPPKKAEPIKVQPPTKEPAKNLPAAADFHDKCAGILKNYVNNDGRANYKNLKRKRSELTTLLNEFAKLDPNEYTAWPKNDKMAFWLNAYNIKLLDIILDNYPIESIRIYRVWWPPSSIRHIQPRDKVGVEKWDRYKFIVMDEQFTLSEIQKRFFRKQFDEPRAFLALSETGLSGPYFRNEPYYGNKLSDQLDDQARKFLSNPRAFKLDTKTQRVYLSALFEPSWHGKDFVEKYGTDKKFKDHPPAIRAVLNFVVRYVSQKDAAFLETHAYDVRFINYDWRLNEY